VFTLQYMECACPGTNFLSGKTAGYSRQITV